MSEQLTHVDAAGRAAMVDVSAKAETFRSALAFGSIRLSAPAFAALREGKVAKGDALAVARIAGIQGAKRAHDLVPLCHPLRLSKVAVDLALLPPDRVVVFGEAQAVDRTGVEIEALAAVQVALLTIIDMTKALSHESTIDEVRLLLKEGGRSGVFLGHGVQRGTMRKFATSPGKGTPKSPTDEVFIKAGFGIDGDAHGGDWHRQVSLLAVESIKKMQDKGLKVDFGSFAENLATEGLSLYELPRGTLFRTPGGVIMALSQIGKTCHTKCAVYHRAGDCVMPREGVFAVAFAGGTVKTDQPIVALNDWVGRDAMMAAVNWPETS